MDKRKKAGAWIITALTVGAVLMLAVPLLIGAGYTYPAADDFIVESGSAYLSGIVGPVRGPLYAAWNYFMNWQGAYTTNLFLFTIMPFSRFGLNGFRVGMVILSLFFLSSLYFMVSSVINYSDGPVLQNGRHCCRNKKLFLYAVLLFTALGLPGTWVGKELFYWYTAALGYYICSMLFGFMASGVSPQVASFVCSWVADCNTGFDLIGGTVQEVFNLRKDVLEALESAEKGTDVYIKMPEIPSTQATYPQGISEDADCQTNKDLAALFHLNSVRVEYGSK